MVTASPRGESGQSKRGEWSLLVQEGRVVTASQEGRVVTASPRGESGHC